MTKLIDIIVLEENNRLKNNAKKVVFFSTYDTMYLNGRGPNKTFLNSCKKIKQNTGATFVLCDHARHNKKYIVSIEDKMKSVGINFAVLREPTIYYHQEPVQEIIQEYIKDNNVSSYVVIMSKDYSESIAKDYLIETRGRVISHDDTVKAISRLNKENKDEKESNNK